jgi:hypothetical protein
MADDALLALAIVGTSRHGQVDPITGTPVDPLIAALPDGEQERTLLLSAGTRAIYLQAGQQAHKGPQLPEPAASEILPVCSNEAAMLLSLLLNGEYTDLLPEALERLHQVGKRLPYHLLPVALAKKEKALQALIFPVLGKRGLWLSRLRLSWKWTQHFLPGEDTGLPTDAETLWQEGTSAQRVELLRRLRAVDPTKARQWLTETWKHEHAEVRSNMLATLAINLHADDEDFLEQALDDRALAVRETAAGILPLLPASALVARMCARGAAILEVSTNKKGRTILQVHLPKQYSEDWKRDGLSEKAPNHLSQRAWWMVQILSRIPPAFWETHAALEPQALVASISQDEWATSVIEGWSRAAVMFRATRWLKPLWQWWETHPNADKKDIVINNAIRYELLKLMEPAELTAIVLELFKTSRERVNRDAVSYLSLLPTPWSTEFGFTFLRLLRATYADLDEDLTTFNTYNDPWFSSLAIVARSLPPACLEEAAQPWEFYEDVNLWQVTYARQMLKDFTDLIHMRQKIYKEIG